MNVQKINSKAAFLRSTRIVLIKTDQGAHDRISSFALNNEFFFFKRRLTNEILAKRKSSFLPCENRYVIFSP